LTDTTNTCRWCAPGFAFDRNLIGEKYQPGTTLCKPLKIEGCIVASYQGDLSDDTCAVCEGGYPDEEMKTCIQWSSLSNGLSQSPTNCLWGTINPMGPGCYRCLSGFVSEEGECINTKHPGCLQQDINKICLMCDVFNGYYMGASGFCKKSQEQLINFE